MTILQLKYIVTISTSSSIREASGKLLVSQPALSATVRDLEEELGIKIFDRNNKGITLTEEGIEFLNYAKQAVSQYELVEHRYLTPDDGKDYYSISMQHYVFAVHSFVSSILKRASDKYSYLIKETKTDEVLLNVRDYVSEIGVLSYSESNKNVLYKIFREYELEFHPFSLEKLKEYPCVTFDQSNEKEFYLSEEALSGYSFEKVIKTNDRATSCEMIQLLNGFAIGTGTLTDTASFLNDSFVSIKLKEEDPLMIGYITKRKHELSDFGKIYTKELEKYKNINTTK